MNIPYPQIKRLPDEEVDAVPQLWNEGYSQIDANMEALKNAINSLEAQLNAPSSSNGTNIQQLRSEIAALNAKIDEVRRTLARPNVTSINGRTGDVIINVAEYPSLARRDGEVFTNLVDNGTAINNISSDSLTDLSHANAARVATMGWFKNNIASLFSNDAGYSASNGRKYFKFPRWIGGFAMEWGITWMDNAHGQKDVNLQLTYKEVYGIFVTADSPHGGLYRAGRQLVNGTVRKITIWWKNQERSGNSWYLVVGTV